MLPDQAVAEPAGVLHLIEVLRARFPKLRFGYFNPPRSKFGKAGPAPKANWVASATA